MEACHPCVASNDVPSQINEADRLAALAACQVLDTEPDPEFDALVGYAARLTNAPIALISLVDETRQWFKARVGVAARETPRNISFCGHAILQHEPLVVSDARLDARFVDNPLVTGELKVVFYAGWPLITADGHALGTLCVIDHIPRELSDGQREAMSLLARQVVLSLELRRAVARGVASARSPVADMIARQEEIVREQREREQLAQLLVHDLKSPLSVISWNVSSVLDSSPLSEDHAEALNNVIAAAKRMQSMLMDLLDVGRAVDGSTGIVARPQAVDAAELVRRAVRETAHRGTGHAQVMIEGRDAHLPVVADAALLTRLLINLIDNAQRYAPPESVIRIASRVVGSALEMSVGDNGCGIADADKLRVFDKYVQLNPTGGRTSQGLGLVFCRLAAKAHGGDIWVEDNIPCGAKFRVVIPNG